jgi:hypothetical protein
MANTKISALPTFTGDTTGVYVVIDNSGLTETYKVTKERFLSGNTVSDWINAGTINSIGWGAITTAPTIGSTTSNSVKYRQINSKNWEVYLSYVWVSGGTIGSGDYIFTLPNSLQFDLTVPGQTVFAGGNGVNTWNQMSYAIPSSGTINNGTVGGQVYALIYDNNRFRIVTTTYGTGIQCWGSGFYGIGCGINMTFSFTST